MRERKIAALLLIEAWILFALVLVLRLQWDMVPFPAPTMDEHAHISYTLDLIRKQAWWPDFQNFPLTDFVSGTITEQTNYLNHPPTFYWLMKLVHAAFPSASLIDFRLLTIGFTMLAIAITMRIGYLLELSVPATGVFALCPLLMHVQQLSGFYNNDSLAVLGGSVCCLGSFYWLNTHRYRSGFFAMLLGIALASVKMTGFLLTTLYVVTLLALRPELRKRLPRMVWVFAITIFGALTLPYLNFWIAYGSPVPTTAGQAQWLLVQSQQIGWLYDQHLPFIPWMLHVLSMFTNQFPDRSELTLLPLLWLPTAFSLSFKRSSGAPAINTMVRASGAATLFLLLAHFAFSWPRYLTYGWMGDALLRYYFPLLPAYCAAAAYLYQWLSKRCKSG